MEIGRMGPSSRMLVATDLSGPSLRAVERAFALARERDAACTVLHAIGMDLEGAWREPRFQGPSV